MVVAGNKNAQFAYNYLIKKHGYSPAQAAGIVGNLMAESSLNTGARNRGDGRDGSDSIGIAQWNQDRARNLHRFASNQGRDVYGLDTQLDYLVHEMNGVEKRAGDRLRNANDIRSATQAGISFERPAGFKWDNPSAGLHYDKRERYAFEIAKSFGGDDATDIVASYAPSSSQPTQVASTQATKATIPEGADPRNYDANGKELTGLKGFGRDVRNSIDDAIGVKLDDDGNRTLWGFTLDGKDSDISNLAGFGQALAGMGSEKSSAPPPPQGGRISGGSSAPVQLQFAESLVNTKEEDDPRKRRGGLVGFGGFTRRA